MISKAKILSISITILAVFTISCSKTDPANSAAEKKTYNSTGVIKAIDAAALKVTIDHQDIPGFMSAMEMSFPAANADVIKGRVVGDTVAFVLEKSGAKASLVTMTKMTPTASAPDGEQLFAANCAECHGAKGEGAKKGIPLISGHALAHSEEEYVQQVVNGKPNKMPAFGDKLPDDQITAIVKYVRTVIQANVKPEQREHYH